MFTKTKITLAGAVVLSAAAAASVAVILGTASMASAATKHHRHHQLAPTIPQSGPTDFGQCWHQTQGRFQSGENPNGAFGYLGPCK